ncbi:MAG: hypothetical protein AAB276_06260 [Pseudomonadota bacterium]
MENLLEILLTGAISSAFTIGALKADIRWMKGLLKRHDIRLTTLERKTL